MKSGEDFRRAMGQADDGFVRVITQALRDLQAARKKRDSYRRRTVPMSARQEQLPAAVSRDA